MTDLCAEMVKLYKGNINFIHRQQNLKPNVYDKVFKPQFQKVLENNSTGIKSTNLNAAIAKADEVKVIAARSVQKMNENMAETEALLRSSQEINLLAKDFQKNAHTLEVTVKNTSWWCCSKPCIIMFVSIGIVLVLLYLLIKIL